MTKRELLREKLLELKNNGYRVFLTANPDGAYGLVHNQQRNTTISINYRGFYGYNLSTCLKPTRLCGTGYHCAGFDGYDPKTFLFDVTPDCIESAISYGNHQFYLDISAKERETGRNENRKCYVYDNIEELVTIRNCGHYEEL